MNYAYLTMSAMFSEKIGIRYLGGLIKEIFDYCSEEDIDIEEAMRIKHEYNKTRSYRHGGKKI